ncbi:MAG: hypothetical protein GX415_02355 [Chloroflexi bacterium]|jgi:hypothetical protein|nr:hypothetical protein [Anaerolineaceae bacterium]NLI44244.1 hypothetical protein [Chloroflexota bacterium]NMD26625.1 hypothetical protein [Chloroflexota bacterium]HOE34664.1 hypothetical protein [Anaerolineaceae bacterium]HOT25787.1 hypothetical protein [Anaerolineaceae bacterium]
MNAEIKILIGKLLRADNRAFVAGCRTKELIAPALGALCKVRLEDGLEIYGLISNIVINDDSLVRQLVSGISIPTEYTEDNRHNRNLPVEINVLCVGFQEGGQIYHRLPPRPPLSLDALYLCDDEELARFTSTGRYAYFRHVLRLEDQPMEEVLTAHLASARKVHAVRGNPDWYTGACKELIVLLRDNYEGLMNVLNALAELE